MVLRAATQGPDPATVTPGLAGFLVVFGLALVTVLLVRSMVGHLRKVRYGPGPDGGQGEPSASGLPAGSPRADGGPGPREG